MIDPLGNRWRDKFYSVPGADEQRVVVDFEDFEDTLFQIGDLQQVGELGDMILIAAREPSDWFLTEAAHELQEQSEAIEAMICELADDMLEGRKSVAEVFDALSIAKNDNTQH